MSIIDSEIEDAASQLYGRKVGERLRSIRRQKGLSLQEAEEASEQKAVRLAKRERLIERAGDDLGGGAYPVAVGVTDTIAAVACATRSIQNSRCHHGTIGRNLLRNEDDDSRGAAPTRKPPTSLISRGRRGLSDGGTGGI